MARRIAVIDDHEPFLQLLTSILVDEGYVVTPVSTPLVAYQVITRERPDLVILDIRMGDPEAGWHILESLRANAEFVTTPIIVCTADERFVRGRRAQLEERGCEVLEKPFEVEELLSVVARALPSNVC